MHLKELEMWSIDDTDVACRVSFPLTETWIRQYVDYEDQRCCVVEESEERL